MNLGYDGKVAVVTGGAAGIGAATVRRLVAEGASVVVGDVDEARLDALRAELGERCATAAVDVALERDIEVLVALAVERFGGVDVAFNVAGTSRIAPIVELTEADWDLQIDICQKGVFLAMKHEARQMIAAGKGGAIVNVASLNAVAPAYGAAGYCAAKAAVCMLTRVGAFELAAHGIRVNAVSPGLTETNLTAGVLGVADARAALLDHIPLGRAASADEQADALLFLGSEAASYITGVNLLVDAGWAQTAFPNLKPFIDASAGAFGQAHSSLLQGRQQGG